MSIKDKIVKLMYEMDKHYHGDHMSSEVADVAVHCLGERFSREWVKAHIQESTTDIEDMYYTINMLYSDYKMMFGENEEMYHKLAYHFIHDEDAPADKVKRYFYAMLE